MSNMAANESMGAGSAAGANNQTYRSENVKNTAVEHPLLSNKTKGHSKLNNLLAQTQAF